MRFLPDAYKSAHEGRILLDAVRELAELEDEAAQVLAGDELCLRREDFPGVCRGDDARVNRARDTSGFS
jgi:hypothetical protein